MKAGNPDKNQNGIGLWQVHNAAGKTLVIPYSEPKCNKIQTAGDAVETVNGNASVAMAPDRSAVAIKRPLPGSGWCVERWSLPDGANLSPILIQRQKTGQVIPFSRDWLFVQKAKYEYQSSFIIEPSGKTLEVNGCVGTLYDPLELFNLDATVIIDTQKGDLSCVSNNNQVLEFNPISSGIGVPLGQHKGAVNALAFDSEQNRLFSVGEDGKLIQWESYSKEKHIQSASEAIELTSEYGKVLALYSNETIEVFDATGKPLSPVIPVTLGDEFHAILTAGGQTLLVYAGEQHPVFYFGDPPQINNTVSLYRVSDGELLTQLKNVVLGDNQAPFPAKCALNQNRGKGVFLTGNEEAVELDLLTGKKIRNISTKEGQLLDFAYHKDAGMWLLASIGSGENAEQETVLLFENLHGERREIAKEKLPGGKLYHSSNNGALVASFIIKTADNRFVSKVFYDGPNRSVTLPSVDFVSGTITFRDNDQVVVFQEKNSPLITFDTKTSTMETVRPILDTYASDTFRVDDPLGRVFVSTDGEKLTIVPLDGVGFCPLLNEMKASAATFSADGLYLAISKYDETVIYDLISCAPVLKREGGVRRNLGILFSDTQHLWVLLNNHIAVLDMSYELEELRETAVKFAQNSKQYSKKKEYGRNP